MNNTRRLKRRLATARAFAPSPEQRYRRAWRAFVRRTKSRRQRAQHAAAAAKWREINNRMRDVLAASAPAFAAAAESMRNFTAAVNKALLAIDPVALDQWREDMKAWAARDTPLTLPPNTPEASPIQNGNGKR